ncbi:MAG: sugar phosphate isomerase/epimerase family protein [Verrucomicrobiia bacterium]|jgi:L-ribulose-5-phosphate 3-epimerase
MHSTLNSRRDFLRTAAAASAVAAFPFASSAAEPDLNGRIFKTLKIGMIRVKGSLTDKFKAAKAAGFEGVELNAPGIDVKDAIAASKAAGLPIDGTVNSGHWQVRHTDASATVRANALKSLKEGLIQTREIGGHTLLLVVGHGKDGAEKDIWDRSIENISKAVPLAAELGVTIAIENVWNQFCYDHGGDSTQSADKFVDYVDAFDSPWVGMQFDLGNHWKYGATGDWVRKLGKRVVKLDIKGFSREKGKFTKIGEGDVDWKDVSKSLHEINFHGWCAAEVGGGDLDRLKEVVANMDLAFGLKSAG